jgi:polyisoprenoid-binding protein YceI
MDNHAARRKLMTQWVIDPDHSVACFAVRHMNIASVRGMFHKLSGTIRFDPPDVTRASVEAEIDVASINTGVKKRDDHLRSAEILDAGQYPKITFRSTGIRPAVGNRASIMGDLTIHGVTKMITFEAEFSGPVKSLFGGETSIGFTAAVRLNREDFGVLWGSDPLEGGGLMTAREIEITLDIEADRAD